MLPSLKQKSVGQSVYGIIFQSEKQRSDQPLYKPMRFIEWLKFREDATLIHGGIRQIGDDDNTNLGCRSKWFGPAKKKPDENDPSPDPAAKFGFTKRDRVKSIGRDINTNRRDLKTDPRYSL